jgi:hypothetical protein
MNGHVFECYEERGDRTQFPKTLEALGEYAAKNLKHPVIWGQCSEAMRTKLCALDTYTTQNRANNCIWLLNEIKRVTNQFDTKRSIFLSLLDARIAYYTCKQAQNQTNASGQMSRFSNIIKHPWGRAIFSSKTLLVH